MKRSVLALIFLALVATLLAQQPVLLRNSQYLGWEGTHVALPNGTTMVFWNDTSSGSSDVLAQATNSEGIMQWTAPRPVASSDQEERILSAVLSSDNSVIIQYYSYSNLDNGYSYRVQKLNQSGQRLWGDDGVLILVGNLNRKGVSITPNAVGGAYAIYRSESSNGEVLGKNLDSNGINLWPQASLFSIPGLYSIDSVEDGQGGIIIKTRTYVSNLGFLSRLFRYNATGNPVGPSPLIDPAVIGFQDYDILRDAQGNYVLYTYPGQNIQMQKIDADGNLLLSTMVTHVNQYGTYISEYKLCPTPEGGIVYAFSWGGINSEFGVVLRNLDVNLQDIWTQPVEFACPDWTFDLCLDASNGIWISMIQYGETFSSINTTVLCARIDNSSMVSFNPMAISSEQRSKYKPIIRAFPAKALVIWNDFSTQTNGLRGQIVSNAGLAMLEQDGREIHGVLNGGAELKQVFALNNGYMQIYEDSRIECQAKIYYQLTDMQGNPTLEDGGRAMNPNYDKHETYLDSKLTAANTTLILYSVYDIALQQYSLYLKEISASDTELSPGPGICVTSSQNSSFFGSLLGNIGNDVIVMWSDTPDGSFYHSFWGQRYSNGIPQWPVEGKLLVAANNNYIYSKALHGDYLVFQQEDYQTFSMSVRALKIGSNGDPAPGWPQGGLAVIPGTTYFAMYLHSGIVNDDLLVFMSYSDQSDVRSSVQKLNSDGQALWGNTGVNIGNNANAYDYWIDDAVYGDNITWIKRVMGVYELRVMSMDQNGNLVWGEEGVDLDQLASEYSEFKLAGFANGTYAVFYTNNFNEFSSGIHRQDISEGGALLNPAPLTIVANRFYLRNLNLATHQDTAMLSWNDELYYDRGDAIPLSSLWTCKMDAYPVSSEDPLIPALAGNAYNFPNPFRNQTTIRFEIKTAEPVQVDIYNLRGQHVRSLLNESKAPGSYDLAWDTKDDDGRAVANGVYLYKIRTGTYSSSKKMILLK